MRVFCMMALGVMVAAAPAAAAPIVSAVPSAFSVPVGGTITVDVGIGLGDPTAIDDVVDLYAYSLTFGFDPTMFMATTVTEGPFLPTGGATTFGFVSIDNTLGRVNSVFGSLIGAVPGVTGSGVLYSVTLQAIATGASLLLPLYELGDGLFDSNLTEISSDSTGPTVNVTIPNVPEPSTWLLIATALAAFVWTYRRTGTTDI